MKIRGLLAVPLLAVASAVAASAQITPASVGFSWSSSSGAFAGTACSGFSCTPDTVSVTAGDAITIRVKGQLGGGYIIALSASANSCVTVPGALNSLVLDFPLTVLALGTTSNPDFILACPGGMDSISAVWPPTISPGTVFALQALATGPAGSPAFTQAILVTVF